MIDTLLPEIALSTLDDRFISLPFKATLTNIEREREISYYWNPLGPIRDI